MKAERLVQVGHHRGGRTTENRTDALDGHGSNLFGLRLGIAAEAGEFGRQEGLERVNPTDRTRHRHNRHDTTAEAAPRSRSRDRCSR